MSRGYVYVLTNEHMPGLVKIGRTHRSSAERAKELYQTGVPSPFTVFAEFYSPDCCELEGWAHKSLAEHRTSEVREFFSIEPKRAEDILRGLHKEQVTVWLDDFLPDVAIVHRDYIVSEDVSLMLAGETGAHPAEVASALSLATADELAPMLDRWRILVAARLGRERRVAQ